MDKRLTEDGFHVYKNALPKDYFAKRPDLHRLDFLASMSDPNDVFNTEHGPKQIQNLHRIPMFQEFAMELARVAGFKLYRIMNMQVFVKYPEYKITSPHQDGAYFNAPEKNIFTFWVPIQDVRVDDSCMHYLPGSHKNGLLNHENIGTKVRTRTGATGYSLAHLNVPLDEYTPCEMELGDVLVHHQLCLHYSSMNRGTTPRKALTLIVETF